MKFLIVSFLLLGNPVFSFAESTSLHLATDGQEQEDVEPRALRRKRRKRGKDGKSSKDKPRKPRPGPIDVNNPFMPNFDKNLGACQNLLASLPSGRAKLATDELRFNKIMFVEREDLYSMLPLISTDYPISNNSNNRNVLRNLQEYSMCPSVVAESDFEVTHNMPDVLKAIGGGPDHPSNDKNAAFWDKLRVVMDVNDLRRANQPVKTVLPHLPSRWSGFSIHEAAEAVRAEVRCHYHFLLIVSCDKINMMCFSFYFRISLFKIIVSRLPSG
jgi:hypothetical protein